jgi:hypothetical protein
MSEVRGRMSEYKPGLEIELVLINGDVQDRPDWLSSQHSRAHNPAPALLPLSFSQFAPCSGLSLLSRFCSLPIRHLTSDICAASAARVRLLRSADRGRPREIRDEPRAIHLVALITLIGLHIENGGQIDRALRILMRDARRTSGNHRGKSPIPCERNIIRGRGNPRRFQSPLQPLIMFYRDHIGCTSVAGSLERYRSVHPPSGLAELIRTQLTMPPRFGQVSWILQLVNRLQGCPTTCSMGTYCEPRDHKQQGRPRVDGAEKGPIWSTHNGTDDRMNRALCYPCRKYFSALRAGPR